jgi:hypothetical protein
MDLKNSINEVKQELSSDEKLLEQAFHLERFFKKYKKPLIALTLILILAFVGYKVNNYLVYSKLEKANSALLALEKDPKNTDALNSLKANNPKLYALYKYSVAANSANKEELSKINKDTKFLEDVINYHISVVDKNPKNSIYYKNLALIQKAYLLIKNNKTKEAKNILIQIPKNSAVAPIARLLEHYTITK